MAIKSAQLYNWDWVYVEKESREITLTQEVKNKIDNIPAVVTDFSSDSETDALSAAAWKILKEQIEAVWSIWHYLSSWDCTSGLPQTDPIDNPHIYKVWDYYIIAVVSTSGSNYKPSDRQYTKWVASTVIETWTPAVNDSYYYDWVNWILQPSWGRVITVDQSIIAWSSNAVAGGAVHSALQGKANISSIPTKLSQLTNDSDFQTGDEVSAAISQATSWIPTKVTQLINDAQYQTLQQVNSAITTATQNCVHTWDNLSSLTNDAWFQTAEQVQAAVSTGFSDWIREWDNISKLTNDAWYQTSAQVQSAVSSATMNSLSSWANISLLTNDVDFQTSAQVQSAVSGYHDSTKQNTLVWEWTWQNIKTINWESILWAWNITVNTEKTKVTINNNSELLTITNTETEEGWEITISDTTAIENLLASI